jgi:hypothetical protein
VRNPAATQDCYEPAERRTQELRDAFSLMRPENFIHSHASTDEFPRKRKVRSLKPHHFLRMERALRKAYRRRHAR